MSRPIVISTAARIEFDQAADWYELRRPGRGDKFVGAVRAVLNRIADHPEIYAEVHEDVREGLVKGYPYCVYYRVENSQLFVIAVFHTSRDPSIWQRRA